MIPMFTSMIETLKANPRKIVFTEGTDARILEATSRLVEGGFLTPVLVGNVEAVKAAAAKGGFNIQGVEILDPATYEGMDEMVETMVALRKGKIKIDPAKRLKMPVTLQDSCNYIRNHGLAEHTRYIMSQIAEDFREMKCNREDNFCCGGGGGFNGIGKFRPQRDKGLYMKLQQIRETGAKMVISPCHNCWDAIRDMMEVYHVHDIKWSFLKPIIIDMMIVPDHLKPQDDE